jgi:integrase
MFAKNGRENGNWMLNNIHKFVQYQKDRVDRKEITAATIRNYVKSINLFCEMADIPIPWKKIIRRVPLGKKYADNRILTQEEIRKLVDYPDSYSLYNCLFLNRRRSVGISSTTTY